MKKGIIVTAGTILGIIAGFGGGNYISQKTIKEKAKKIDKFKSYYQMLNQWLMLKQQGVSLEAYFSNHNYKTIAIYGMGEMGNRLYDELKNTDIEVKYAIDKAASNTYAEVQVLDTEDSFPKVDIIIVSAIFDFENIEEMLRGKTDLPIISLEDIIYEM